MRSLFSEVPSACDNTLWIAERAELEIAFGESQLPDFPLPEPFTDADEYLRHLTFEGAKERWGATLSDDVVERLTYELRVIQDMPSFSASGLSTRVSTMPLLANPRIRPLTHPFGQSHAMRILAR